MVSPSKNLGNVLGALSSAMRDMTDDERLVVLEKQQEGKTLDKAIQEVINARKRNKPRDRA